MSTTTTTTTTALAAADEAPGAEVEQGSVFWLWKAAVWTVMVVGTWLRWRNLGRESLWLDEGVTAWAASLPFREIVHVLYSDNSPPLMYFAVRCWVAVFGDSEFAIRSLSAAASTAAMIVFYFLTRRVLRGTRAAGLAATLAMCLFAVSERQVMYSHEARFYSLLMLWFIIALACMKSYLDRRSWWSFAGVALSCAALMYTHNVGACYVLGVNAAWLLLPSDRPVKARLKEIVLLDACVGLLYLPYVPMLLAQLRTVNHNFWGGTRGIEWFPRLWAGIVGVNAFHTGRILFRHVYLPFGSEAGIMRVVLVLSGSAMLAGVVRSNRRESLEAAGWWACAIVPLAATYLATQLGFTLFLMKPVSTACIVVPLVLALPVAFATRPLTRLATAAVAIAVLALCVQSVAVYDRYNRYEDWRGLTAYVASLPPANRVIVFNVTEGQLNFDYYWKRFRRNGVDYPETGTPEGFFEIDPPTFLRRVDADDDLRHLRELVESGKYDEICLIRCHSYWGDDSNRCGNYLLANGRLVDETTFKGASEPLGSNLDVQRYAVARATTSRSASSPTPSATSLPPGSSGNP